MSILNLRDYQAEAVSAVRRAWARGIRRPAVILPTGAGKTVCFAHLVAQMRERGIRSVILAHRNELIEQAAGKLHAVAPDLSVGILKASRQEVEGRDVVVASVQSLVSERRRGVLAEAGFRLLIVDECHHAVADTYAAVMRDMGCFETDPMQGAYALGVTATMGRGDRVALNQAWEEVVYEKDILWMIRNGYLVNPRGVQVRIEGLDFDRIRRMHGDFAESALARQMHESLAPRAIAEAYLEHAKDRRGVLFAPGVQMAHEMADGLLEVGVEARVVHGGTPTDERREVLAAYARGDVQVLSNAMVLTEGWDAPWCSAVVVARPTSSAPLYTQMVGRGLRLYPGKSSALVLDVVGVSTKHRLATINDLTGAERADSLDDELAAYEQDGLIESKSDGTGGIQANYADGPLVSEIVDLFTSSRQAWLRTRRGVWFLSAGDQLIFLTPGSEPGSYSVARCPARAQGGEWLREGCDLETAMSWGEQFAADGHGVLTRRSASWRKAPPSQGQLNAAVTMGIDTAGLSKGELSDAISTVIASQRLDLMPCVASVSERSYW